VAIRAINSGTDKTETNQPARDPRDAGTPADGDELS
jgi:hypothetical protein